MHECFPSVHGVSVQNLNVKSKTVPYSNGRSMNTKTDKCRSVLLDMRLE